MGLAIDASLAQPPLQFQRCQHGSLGMILLGRWRSKNSHNALADHRLEGSAIALHRVPGQNIEIAYLEVAHIRLRRR